MGRPAFFPNRAILDRESPLADKLGNCAVVYAMWMTGAKATQEIWELGIIKRLMLVDPGSKSLSQYQLAMPDPRDLASEIRIATKSAKNRNLKVRWLREFPGYTLTIGNPEGKDAWAQIELAFPSIPGGNHPSLEFRKPTHAETVDNVINAFNSLWENDSLSWEPTDKDLINGDG